MQVWHRLVIPPTSTLRWPPLFRIANVKIHTYKHAVYICIDTKMYKREKEWEKDGFQHDNFSIDTKSQHTRILRICEIQISTVWKAQNEAADWRSPTVDICTLPPSFGTWPPSPYGHHSPVGHSFGLCHPSIVLDPLSAFAIPSSNPYGCSLTSASIEDWFGTLCQDLSSPLGMIKSWSKIGHMTNSHCWFLWR